MPGPVRHSALAGTDHCLLDGVCFLWAADFMHGTENDEKLRPRHNDAGAVAEDGAAVSGRGPRAPGAGAGHSGPYRFWKNFFQNSRGFCLMMVKSVTSLPSLYTSFSSVRRWLKTSVYCGRGDVEGRA